MIALALAVATAVRVVSLSPALTEDLFAIGAGPEVVAVDTYSNRPAAALALPRVGSMRAINSEVIAALAPTLVVGIPYEEPNLRDIGRTGVRTESLPMDTLAQDFAAIARLGVLTGHVAGATTLLASLHRRLERIARATQALPQPTAFVVIDTAPIYTAGAGSYIGDLLRIVHVANAVPGIVSAFPSVSAETLEAEDPDLLIVTRRTVIPKMPPWSNLRAVREHHIVTVDEDDLFRAGPRVADVAEALARAIAPLRQRKAGGTAKASTAPPGSRRTAIGMP
jgi:iron complex transport system substrate-binding protein